MANSDASDSTKDQPNYDTCGVACATKDCKKTCCKDNTPAHQSYGIHACSDHK